MISKGTIFKNRRHHPDRVFVVTEVKNVKVGGRRLQRVNGLMIVQDGSIHEESLLSDTLARELGYVMFAP
jgi:hypothetical protein